MSRVESRWTGVRGASGRRKRESDRGYVNEGEHTFHLAKHPVNSARAPAARHGDVEFVDVVGCCHFDSLLVASSSRFSLGYL